MHWEENELPASYLIRDRDRKFDDRFDDIIGASGGKPVVLPRSSPNLNAYAERAILSLKKECLDHFVLMGECHVNHVIREYVDFYNTKRPHSSIGKLPPVRDGPRLAVGEIKCESRLGGLLKHYYREAA